MLRTLGRFVVFRGRKDWTRGVPSSSGWTAAATSALSGNPAIGACLLQLFFYNLLLASQYVSTTGNITRLDLLLGKSVLWGAHFVQIRAFWIIAAHILDERRTVFGRAVRGSNITILQKDSIQSQDARQGIFLLTKGNISTGTGSSGVSACRLTSIEDNLSNFSVLSKILWTPQDILIGYARRQTNCIYQVSPNDSHISQERSILGRFNAQAVSIVMSVRSTSVRICHAMLQSLSISFRGSFLFLVCL
jgi:hypothetical protein